jgi:hypothetical protein
MNIDENIKMLKDILTFSELLSKKSSAKRVPKKAGKCV